MMTNNEIFLHLLIPPMSQTLIDLTILATVPSTQDSVQVESTRILGSQYQTMMNETNWNNMEQNGTISRIRILGQDATP